MRDVQARIIYIGKAKDLRKRVASYFQKPQASVKTASLVSVIKHIDYIATDSERESLLLEQKLIRRIQPFYNTMWRDDKSYPYVKLTYNEDYPRLIMTRQRRNDGGRYFGPYPHVSVIKKLLRSLWLNKIVPLRPCRFEFHQQDIEKGLAVSKPALNKKVQSCIYLHTGECPAPCVKKISGTDYLKIAKQAELFFTKKSGSLVRELEKQMKQAAEKLDYERASHLRDQINALTHIAEKVTIRKIEEQDIVQQTRFTQALTELQTQLHLPSPPLRIEAFDISNIQGTEPVASMVLFVNGQPSKSEYRKFKIKTVQGPNDFAMMHEVVTRRYRRLSEENGPFPDLVLVDGGKGQLSSALQAIQTLRKAGYKLPQLPAAGLAKQREEIFIPDQKEPICLPKDSLALHVLQHIRDEAHRFAITFHRYRRNKFAIGRN